MTFLQKITFNADKVQKAGGTGEYTEGELSQEVDTWEEVEVNK